MKGRGTMLILAAMASVSCSATSMPEGRRPAGPGSVEAIRESIVRHAPYKQWDIATGRPNEEIGRAPGAACEAISYLALDARTTGDAKARRKAVDLSTWIIDLQSRSSTLPVPGGVPSTPDLPAPKDAYHYSIDAAFCGTAMLDMAEIEPDPRYRTSAIAFGRFLSSMMRDQNGISARPGASRRGLCEAVVQPVGAKAAWDCRRFVKNLTALPLLVRLDRIDRGMRHADEAKEIRASLVPGLKGLWEWSEGSPASPTWRRIQGPEGQQNMFVFGDTLAYGLKGLVAYEGASPDVRAMYADFGSPRSRSAKTTSYDSRIAYPGYVVADQRAADPASAYYDIVTMGLLDPVRAAVSTADRDVARKEIAAVLTRGRSIGWHMDMRRRVREHGMTDASTLAAIGTATLRSMPSR